MWITVIIQPSCFLAWRSLTETHLKQRARAQKSIQIQTPVRLIAAFKTCTSRADNIHHLDGKQTETVTGRADIPTMRLCVGVLRRSGIEAAFVVCFPYRHSDVVGICEVCVWISLRPTDRDCLLVLIPQEIAMTTLLYARDEGETPAGPSSTSSQFASSVFHQMNWVIFTFLNTLSSPTVQGLVVPAYLERTDVKITSLENVLPVKVNYMYIKHTFFICFPPICQHYLYKSKN